MTGSTPSRARSAMHSAAPCLSRMRWVRRSSGRGAGTPGHSGGGRGASPGTGPRGRGPGPATGAAAPGPAEICPQGLERGKERRRRDPGVPQPPVVGDDPAHLGREHETVGRPLRPGRGAPPAGEAVEYHIHLHRPEALRVDLREPSGRSAPGIGPSDPVPVAPPAAPDAVPFHSSPRSLFRSAPLIALPGAGGA